MLAVQKTCSQCGANGNSAVCGYCGNLLDPVQDIAGERAALDSLHDFLQLVDRTRQRQLLRNGYLPDSREVLIEAGMRLLPLCNHGDGDLEPRDSALARLKTVISKLKILHAGADARRAIDQFEATIRSARHSDFWSVVLALGLFIVLPATGLCWWFSG